MTREQIETEYVKLREKYWEERDKIQETYWKEHPDAYRGGLDHPKELTVLLRQCNREFTDKVNLLRSLLDNEKRDGQE